MQACDICGERLEEGGAELEDGRRKTGEQAPASRQEDRPPGSEFFEGLRTFTERVPLAGKEPYSTRESPADAKGFENMSTVRDEGDPWWCEDLVQCERPRIFTDRWNDREEFTEMPASTRYGEAVLYTGPTLSQDDLDVWLILQRLEAESEKHRGAKFEVDVARVLRSYGLRPSPRHQEKFEARLDRLEAARIIQEEHGGTCGLIVAIEGKGTNTYTVELDQQGVEVLGYYTYALEHWSERDHLASYERWLHAQFAGQAQIFRTSSDALWKLSGTNSTRGEFRANLRHLANFSFDGDEDASVKIEQDGREWRIHGVWRKRGTPERETDQTAMSPLTEPEEWFMQEGSSAVSVEDLAIWPRVVGWVRARWRTICRAWTPENPKGEV
jgi:hypothetical protein